MSAVQIPVNPDKRTFAAAARKMSAAVLPLVFKLPNDGLFVWSAFARLEEREPYAFLLESAETGPGGRYSLMGGAPRRLFFLRDKRFIVARGNGEILSETPCVDPFVSLGAELEEVNAPADGRLPPFLGGVVGYLGYDCVHYFEPLGDMKKDEIGVPDMLWMQTDMLAVFDHFRHELYVIKNCYRADVGDDWETAYDAGVSQTEEWLRHMQVAPPPLRLPKTGRAEERAAPLPPSSHTPESFAAMVERAKEHIRLGDIFQVVPSQRFSFPQPATALEIYRALRRINPSPYMFHLKCGDFAVIGSSPELMLNIDDGALRLRPIAGTRPRGRDAAEDVEMEAQLRADEKEIAEHLMLVDLGRNDLGRVAAIGSVVVPKEGFCRIERYSHVMHMVSDVEARLAADKTPLDAARAAFPAGTLSGAPKVRAMEIINDLEHCKRNIYGGFAGYIGHNRDMRTCIIIRAMLVKDGVCHVQAGGGVVADSSGQKEYEESVNKAMAVLRAARLAAETAEAAEAE